MEQKLREYTREKHKAKGKNRGMRYYENILDIKNKKYSLEYNMNRKKTFKNFEKMLKSVCVCIIISRLLKYLGVVYRDTEMIYTGLNVLKIVTAIYLISVILTILLVIILKVIPEHIKYLMNKPRVDFYIKLLKDCKSE